MSEDIASSISNLSGRQEDDNGKTDGPPHDDCCPICFGSFDIPCRTNCGHWYCANCILQYWESRASLKQCKCPMCSCFISKLMPQASLLEQQEEEVVQVLKKIKKYNHLYIDGAYGLWLKVLALPLFFKRFFQELINPDSFRNNWQRMRLFAYLIGFLYNLCHFQIVPSGALRFKWVIFQTNIDLWLSSLVIVLYFVGLGHRWLRRRRVRGLAAVPPRDI